MPGYALLFLLLNRTNGTKSMVSVNTDPPSWLLGTTAALISVVINLSIATRTVKNFVKAGTKLRCWAEVGNVAATGYQEHSVGQKHPALPLTSELPPVPPYLVSRRIPENHTSVS